MATPSNAVRYPMNAQTQFMLCRSCRNHLATFNNCLGQAFDGLLCHTVENVRTDDIAAPTLFHGLPAVNVHCNGCSTHIGGRFISPDNPRFNERYLFLLDRMLYWDGTRGLRDAVTHEPINEADNNDPRESAENRMLDWDGTKLDDAVSVTHEPDDNDPQSSKNESPENKI